MTSSSRVVSARVTGEPLDVEAILAAVEHPGAGAVTSFVGRVRDHDPEVEGVVEALEYEAHPDAAAVLTRIAAAVAGDRDVRVAAGHRTGRLAVGDAAVAIAVSSAHRAEAFEVCRDLIERIKTDLPVWKRQTTADGRTAWVGLGDDAQPPANGGRTSASSA